MFDMAWGEQGNTYERSGFDVWRGWRGEVIGRLLDGGVDVSG